MLCKSSCDAKSLNGRRTCTVPETLVTFGFLARDWANFLAASSGLDEKSEAELDEGLDELPLPEEEVLCAI